MKLNLRKRYVLWLLLIIAALVDRGEEVIIGDPAFLSYLELTKLVGGRPVSVPLDENLRLSPEVLEAIDAECSRRAGSVSRNTWITEAVTERLARLASSSRSQSAGGANG